MVYGNVVRGKIAFVMLDLTFRNISFAILFCQKKVKKICMSLGFSLKIPIMISDGTFVKYVPLSR